MTTIITAGTISVVSGSTSVSGSGTAWVLSNVQEGDLFTAGGAIGVVQSVESDTALTLATPWSGATLSGEPFTIRREYRRGDAVQANERLLEYVEELRNGTLAQPDGYVTNSVPLSTFDNEATGFTVLDLTADPITARVKRSATAGDWTTPQPWLAEGQKGDTGTAGTDGTNGVDGRVFQDLIINGAFEVNQRGYAGAALSGSAYAHDRWKGSPTVQYSKSGKTITLQSGTLEQVIENAMFGDISNENVIVQAFNVGTRSLNVQVAGGAVANIPVGAGWQSAVVPVGANAGNNTSVRLFNGAGSGSATFERLAMFRGNTLVVQDPRPREVTRLLCYRYFQTINNPTFSDFTTGRMQLATNLRFPLQHMTQMRATPSFTFSGTIANLRAYGNGGFADASAITTLASSSNEFKTIVSLTLASGLTANHAAAVRQNSGTSAFFLNSEL